MVIVSVIFCLCVVLRQINLQYHLLFPQLYLRKYLPSREKIIVVIFFNVEFIIDLKYFFLLKCLSNKD